MPDLPPAALPDLSSVPLDSGVVAPIGDEGTSGPPKIEGYEILDKLGQGGMGTVWHAIQLGTRRKVALKLMSATTFANERARARFDREVELTARLDHPNIAAVYDSGLDRGVYFYAMERVDGTPLDVYVESHKMSRRDILELMRMIGAAVFHAHQRGVIHRDLKPGNILIDADGHPHIVDFGLAKTVLHEQGELAISIETDVAGTPAYMAPEQAAGHVDKLDTRTDVYSLGVLLYRLLLGVHPHDLSGTQLEILRRISDTDVKRPRLVDPSIDRDLEAILLKALSHNPDDRYGSAGSFTHDINNYLNGNPLLARPATFSYVLRKQLIKHLPEVCIAAVVLVVLVAMGVYAYVRVTAEREQLLFLMEFENAVSRMPTIHATLREIVIRAMEHSGADAGSLFAREGDHLRFEVARNKTLERREGATAAAQHFTKFTVPISQESIAGYVAATARTVNLPDAYNIPPGVPYRFNPEFDRRNGYHTQSMLAVPLTAPDGTVLGVLQLINRMDSDGTIEPFPPAEEEMIHAMAGRAAVALHYATASTQPTTRSE
jgi:hypothetical protein